MDGTSPARTGYEMRASVAAIAAAALVLAGCGEPVGELAPGDCFVQADLGAEVDTVPVVSCDEPHDSEVFHVFDLEFSDFDQDAVDAAAGETCEAAFEDYVGIPYWDSQYLFLSLTPTEAGWRDVEQRQVICFVWPGEGINLTASVEGSRD